MNTTICNDDERNNENSSEISNVSKDGTDSNFDNKIVSAEEQLLAIAKANPAEFRALISSLVPSIGAGVSVPQSVLDDARNDAINVKNFRMALRDQAAADRAAANPRRKITRDRRAGVALVNARRAADLEQGAPWTLKDFTNSITELATKERPNGALHAGYRGVSIIGVYSSRLTGGAARDYTRERLIRADRSVLKRAADMDEIEATANSAFEKGAVVTYLVASVRIANYGENSIWDYITIPVYGDVVKVSGFIVSIAGLRPSNTADRPRQAAFDAAIMERGSRRVK